MNDDQKQLIIEALLSSQESAPRSSEYVVEPRCELYHRYKPSNRFAEKNYGSRQRILPINLHQLPADDVIHST